MASAATIIPVLKDENGKRLHEGKLAIVTGSARSIGAAIARNLASKGCNILINYATPSSDSLATALVAELESSYHVRATAVRADISQASECARIIDAARARFTINSASSSSSSSSPSPPSSSSTTENRGTLQIDILIHNAAVLFRGPLESVVEADFHRIYAVNVLGPILLTAACRPYLPTDRSGRIVMVSSISSKCGLPHSTLYGGTKGALEAMARIWSRELAERATVNSINPGPTMTDMYLSAPDDTKQRLAAWNPVTPLVPVRETDSPEVKELGEKLGGRAAYEHEIAGLVAMLCHPEAGWCTGSLVSANGGLSFSY